MANLQELRDMILSLKNNGKSGKIYFYRKANGQLRSGIITISEGRVCNINHLKQNSLAALAELRSLEFTSLMMVPYEKMDVGTDGAESLDITIALQLLETDNQQEMAAWGVKTPVPAKLDRSVANHFQQEARSLLEKFYGSGATIKVDEIAIYYPPHEKPREFLDKCKGLAVLMLGADKAEKQFKSLYAKIP